MTEGDVVEHVRKPRDGHGLHPANGEVSLALAHLRSIAGHDESVADSNASRIAAFSSIRSDQFHCARHHRIMAAGQWLICAELMTNEIGVEEWEGIDEYLAVFVAHNYRARQVLGVAYDPDTRAQHARIGRESLTAVVIARDYDDRDGCLAQAKDCVIEDAECLDRRHCPVEDISGDDKEIDLSVYGRSHQQIDCVALSID